MTLRLALVIEGDGSGAKKTLQETTTAVEELGRKSEETGRKLGQVDSAINWSGGADDQDRLEELSLGAEEAAGQIRALGDDSRQAAGGVDQFASSAQDLTPEITKAGDAADIAGGKFGDLRGLLIGAAGGVAAALAIAGIAEGLRIAVGYAGDLYREITSNQPAIERALKGHADLVDRIKGAWAEAEGAASSYGVNSTAQLRFESQQNVGRLEGALEGALSDLEGRGAFAPLMQDRSGGRDRLGPLREKVSAFRRELHDGEADVIAFRRRVAEIAEALPEESPFRGLAEVIFADTQAAAELQAELERSRDLLDGLKGDAEAAATALGGSADKYRDLADGAGTAAPAIETSNDRIRGSGEAAHAAISALQEYDRLLKSIGDGSPVEAPRFMTTRDALTTPVWQDRGFAAGGFTGAGDPREPAGIVHRSEYVFDAGSTARIGVRNLDAMRHGMLPGYAAGGFVGVMPSSGGYSGPGGGSPTVALAEEFRILQGAAHQFGMVLWRAGDAGDALASVIQSVSQRFLDFSLRALDRLLLGGGAAFNPGGSAFGLIGNLLGLGAGSTSYFPPAPVPVGSVGLYHGGGQVGPSPAASRLVPAAVFVDAPKLHQGGWLKPGERPVIAMDGEEVGWPDQLAQKYGGGRTVINNFHVETPSPRAFAESRAVVARAAGRITARAARYE